MEKERGSRRGGATPNTRVITSQEEYSDLLVTLNMKAEDSNKLDPEQLLLEKQQQEN